MGPALLVYIGIILIPFFLSFYYSLTDWNGISRQINFVGFENFIRIFTNDPQFSTSFWFSTKLSIIVVVLTNILGFTFAYLLVQPLKLRNLWRTIFFLPNVLGGLILGFIWQFVFRQGFAAIGELTNIPFFQLYWLSTPNTAFWGIVIVSVWQGVGYVMIIYIAGLINIPKDYIEAARVDGASGMYMLKRIIFPLIMPAITVCLFWSINMTYKIFDLNYSLTGGGPYKSSESVALNIYFEAYQNFNYGIGSAKAIVFLLIVAIITGIQVYMTKKKEVRM
ncbi:sugar ABC transporter permease [Evansella sp. AB-P1]|uniref:carbohydrate ABC transporter permease n=1 Tax=Evansella sp. AB-P1 TaxID=3037653 RepID=UPI00241C873B|nr:sugar ABC transporter permease [Evansella sp. AB-P1]MDG5787154.1 sugar ABC transporter permease [Evansella sp. AB-P1]